MAFAMYVKIPLRVVMETIIIIAMSRNITLKSMKCTK